MTLDKLTSVLSKRRTSRRADLVDPRRAQQQVYGRERLGARRSPPERPFPTRRRGEGAQVGLRAAAIGQCDLLVRLRKDDEAKIVLVVARERSTGTAAYPKHSLGDIRFARAASGLNQGRSYIGDRMVIE